MFGGHTKDRISIAKKQASFPLLLYFFKNAVDPTKPQFFHFSVEIMLSTFFSILAIKITQSTVYGHL
jgi:hypothetical protein